MLARILALHPEICAVHEPRPHLLVEAYASWEGRHAQERIRTRIRDKREDLICQVQTNNLIYVESSHYASHIIADLHSLFNARFVHLHRDGRDFVRSGLQRDWYSHAGFRERTTAWMRRRLLFDLGNSWTDHQLRPPHYFKSRFERIAWLWSTINETILRAKSVLPDDTFFTLPVERLEADTLARLLDFVGVSRSGDLSRRMLDLARSRPNRSDRLDAPPSEYWGELQQRQFYDIAGATMTRLGYWTSHSSIDSVVNTVPQ